MSATEVPLAVINNPIQKVVTTDTCEPNSLLYLQAENKTAIFLNHQAILKNEYEKHLIGTSKCYALNPKLFNFKAKPEEQAPDNAEEPKRKKARKCDPIPASSDAEAIQTLLAQLKAEHCLPSNKTNENSEEIPRYWEQAVEFPQLNGGNLTSSFQKFHYNQLSYLIPPQSHFYNYDVKLMTQLLPELGKYDLLVMDPPWRNKYIRRLKRVRLDLAYKMLYNEELAAMPIKDVIHKRTIAAIWCTNSEQHKRSLETELLPKWGLKLLHKLKWFKLNTSCELISPLNVPGKKQPYEMLYIATHQESEVDFACKLKAVDMLLSVPSIIHSHKPPLLSWLAEYLPERPECLEIFGRYLQPSFTTIGIEAMKLMDLRLYEEYEVKGDLENL